MIDAMLALGLMAGAGAGLTLGDLRRAAMGFVVFAAVLALVWLRQGAVVLAAAEVLIGVAATGWLLRDSARRDRPMPSISVGLKLLAAAGSGGVALALAVALPAASLIDLAGIGLIAAAVCGVAAASGWVRVLLAYNVLSGALCMLLAASPDGLVPVLAVLAVMLVAVATTACGWGLLRALADGTTRAEAFVAS